jgi:hypothetical protein
VDVRTELLVNGVPVAQGELSNITTGSSGFNNALLRTIDMSLSGPNAPLVPGTDIGFRVSVRRTCSGGGHNSGTVRLWYNGSPVDSGPSRDAGSRVTFTVAQSAATYFLTVGSALSTAAGTSRQFVDAAVNSSVACPARPFVQLGVWTAIVP